MTDTGPVLVTGGTGFLAGHIIARLLADGYRVRTTVRSPRREADVRAALSDTGADPTGLSFVTTDLTSNDGWHTAMAGARYLLHVASPFPARQPRDENDLIGPARDGTLRVLRAAAGAGVHRVVMTSSFAAIGYSPKSGDAPYDESDWTDVTAGQTPYVKSKTLAERAAWDFAAEHGLDLSVVNPVGIFGPLLGRDIPSSVALVQALLDGKPPLLPRASFAVVDVRDVADLHLRAMTTPRASGERFLASAGQPVTLPEIAATIRTHLGGRAGRVPTRDTPDWVVRLAARVVPGLETFAGLLGPAKAISTAKAAELLDWQPRSPYETITATAESLLAPH